MLGLDPDLYYDVLEAIENYSQNNRSFVLCLEEVKGTHLPKDQHHVSDMIDCLKTYGTTITERGFNDVNAAVDGCAKVLDLLKSCENWIKALPESDDDISYMISYFMDYVAPYNN